MYSFNERESHSHVEPLETYKTSTSFTEVKTTVCRAYQKLTRRANYHNELFLRDESAKFSPCATTSLPVLHLTRSSTWLWGLWVWISVAAVKHTRWKELFESAVQTAVPCRGDPCKKGAAKQTNFNGHNPHTQFCCLSSQLRFHFRQYVPTDRYECKFANFLRCISSILLEFWPLDEQFGTNHVFTICFTMITGRQWSCFQLPSL